jgi:hypothetical protein
LKALTDDFKKISKVTPQRVARSLLRRVGKKSWQGNSLPLIVLDWGSATLLLQNTNSASSRIRFQLMGVFAKQEQIVPI